MRPSVSESIIVGVIEDVPVVSSFAIKKDWVCLSIVPALYAVKPFVQYLQNEVYYSQNNAKTKQHECWENVLQPNTGKDVSITHAFWLLTYPVLEFSIRYAILL